MINLEKLDGKRIKIRTVIKEITTKKGWQDHITEIIIFKNILNTKGHILKFESEMNYGKRFKEMNLKVGDFISFYAIIKYDKGLRDYKFVNPNNIVIIERKKEEKIIKLVEKEEKEDLVFRMENRKEINKKIISQINDINDYEILISLYKYVKNQIILKELFTINELLWHINNFSREEKQELCKIHSINIELLNTILMRVFEK